MMTPLFVLPREAGEVVNHLVRDGSYFELNVAYPKILVVF